MPRVKLDPSQLQQVEPPKLSAAWFKPSQFDKQGRSDVVIVTLNYDDTELREHAIAGAGLARGAAHHEIERAVVDLLDGRTPGDRAKSHPAAAAHAREALNALFQGPLGARYLTASNRLDVERRVPGRADDARELLERFVALRYATPESASEALQVLLRKSVVATSSQDFGMRQSANPTDFYFSIPTQVFPRMTNFQWGMHAMNFPAAWDRTGGHAYVGLIDAPLWNDVGYQAPCCVFGRMQPVSFAPYVNDDLTFNFRQQFAGISVGAASDGWLYDPDGSSVLNLATGHPRHVAGIIAARSSLSRPNSGDGWGVAGGCASCSLIAIGTLKHGLGDGNAFDVAQAVSLAVDRGAQALNISINKYGDYWGNCPDSTIPFCVALDYAAQRSVLVIVSSGNTLGSAFGTRPPLYPSAAPTVLGVSAMGTDAPGDPTWTYDWRLGELENPSYPGVIQFSSTYAPADGVAAPGVSILSTYAGGQVYNPYLQCGDQIDWHNSVYWDGSTQRFPGHDVEWDAIGTCTGTSMAAPHVTALAAILRSAKPTATYESIRAIIRGTATAPASGAPGFGYGVPNAAAALNALIGPVSAAANRLTPLFAFYSPAREDSLYTTVPQMAVAAVAGTLEPHNGYLYPPPSDSYTISRGVAISSYTSFPSVSRTPTAEAWIFTTPENPAQGGAKTLVPLYRLSYACAHQLYSTSHAKCSASAAHTDTAYATSQAQLNAFTSLGYRLDGLEGYVYPSTQTQPAGTQRLLMRYHPGRDDHAIFPESLLAQYQAEGYSQVSGIDWLGYVYVNTGPVPTVN